MRSPVLALVLVLGCAARREVDPYFPTPGPLFGSHAASLLVRIHQPSMLMGADRMRLLETDAWYQSAIVYTLAPVADSGIVTLVEAPKDRKTVSRAIPIGRERWLATQRHLEELGLLSAAPASGEPPALDGHYLLWEIRRGGAYASATYGEPLSQAANWLEDLVEHPR